MILSDRQILAAMDRGEIVIDPFDMKRLGSNSYDVTLGEHLLTYKRRCTTNREMLPLDVKSEMPITPWVIPEHGFTLEPGTLYLGATVEYTETHRHVPFIEGKSSLGRLGIFIHCTAGRGDVGFCNHWTLELSVVEPVRVYAGMPIGQLIYYETGPVNVSYDKKASAKYNGRNPMPMASQMWKNFEGE